MPTKQNKLLITLYARRNLNDASVVEFYASDPLPFGAELLWVMPYDKAIKIFGEVNLLDGRVILLKLMPR